MKEIFLSFRLEYFKPLLYGIKKYEYRKRFCNEETKAYLYLSGKARQVIGVMELGKPIRLDLTKEEYKKHPETLKRVEKYIESRDVYAIPIKSLALFENPISLEKIREEIPNFMPPQMYYILNNYPKLKTLLENQALNEKLFYHKHEEIYYENLAMSVSELEKTDEFKNLHSSHKKNTNFKNIKY